MTEVGEVVDAEVVDGEPFDSETEAALDRTDNRLTQALDRITQLEKELSHGKALYAERDLEARILSFGLCDIQELGERLGQKTLAAMAQNLRLLPAKYDTAKFEELIAAATVMSEAMHNRDTRRLRVIEALKPFQRDA